MLHWWQNQRPRSPESTESQTLPPGVIVEAIVLAAQIDVILADFIRRRIPFSHCDVADRIPDLLDEQREAVRQLVFEKMLGVPAYRMSIAHFVGEGRTLLCIPCDAALDLSRPTETPATKSEPLAA